MAVSVEEGMEPVRSRLEQPSYFACNFELLASGTAHSDWSENFASLTRVWQYNRRLSPGIHSLRMLLCWLCSFQQQKLYVMLHGVDYCLKLFGQTSVWILCLVLFNIGTLPLILCVTFTFILEATYFISFHFQCISMYTMKIYSLCILCILWKWVKHVYSLWLEYLHNM